MTSFTSKLRTDLLPESETTEPQRVLIEYVYDLYIENAQRRVQQQEPLKSIGPAKELDECFDLIQQAILSKEAREGLVGDAKLKLFSWEDPTEESQLEAITILPTLRLPAQISSGRPDKGNSKVREFKYRIREEGVDPDNHNYRIAVLGKMYDNWVEFTCWARGNRTAFRRAQWFDDLITEYGWYFTMNGVSRIIVQGSKPCRNKKIGDNVIYGYPIECFIRTEKVTTVSEKTLEQLILQIGIADS